VIYLISGWLQNRISLILFTCVSLWECSSVLLCNESFLRYLAIIIQDDSKNKIKEMQSDRFLMM
jgi:hypothetical protein